METEAKFTVPNKATFDQLREVDRFDQFTRHDDGVKQVEDRYVDTPDHRFYGQQYYARLRSPKDKGSLLLTLKQLGGDVNGAIHSREEYQTEVPGLDIATWPKGKTRSIAEEIAHGETLIDLVTVSQTRLVSHLLDGDRKVAEYSLDEVTIQTPHGPAKAYELEVELLPDGTVADLHVLTHIFVDTYKLTPQPLSKFERAIALSAGGPPAEQDTAAATTPAVDTPDATKAPKTPKTPKGEKQSAKKPDAKPAGKEPGPKPVKKEPVAILPTDSIEVAARKLLERSYSKMLSNEDGVRSGEDVAAIHDMRVATRRMRATLRALGDHLAGQDVAKVQHGVRAVTGALGAVRDLDVLISNAKSYQGGLQQEQQGDLETLLDEWDSKRKRAHKKLMQLLHSKEYRNFRKQTERYIRSGDAAAPPSTDSEVRPFQVRHIAGSVLWGQYEGVRAFETVMDAPTLAQLHALRIKGKYLRYTLECFRDTLPPDATALIQDVVKMQDQLGELHDADVAAGLTRAHIARRQKKVKKTGDGAYEVPVGLAAYLADREEAVRHIHASFFSTWPNLNSIEWRTRFADAIAAL